MLVIQPQSLYSHFRVVVVFTLAIQMVMNLRCAQMLMYKQSKTVVPSLKTLARSLVAVASLLLLLAGCGNEAQESQGGFPPTAVSVAEVIVRDVTPWEEFSGRIEAKEIVQIRPRVGGVIEEIRYREGDIVKKGDLLFVIDQQPFRAELNRAEADLVHARSQSKLSRIESQRATDLLKKKLISQGEYDRDIATEHQANANVRAAKATVQLARLNLGYTEIHSPVSGRTSRALVTKGNLISSDPTPDLLTTVVSIDPVYVIFDSDELTYLRYFGNSQQSAGQDRKAKRVVYVGLGNEDGFTREGYVDFIDNQVNPNTGTIRLRAVLDNKDHRLIPGLFARVKLLAATSEQMILINEQSILTDQDRKFVYVLGDENKAMRRNIMVGRNIEGLRVVTKGLKPGDKIIVYGIQKIFFPNMPVMPNVIGMNDPPSSPGPMSGAGH